MRQRRKIALVMLTLAVAAMLLMGYEWRLSTHEEGVTAGFAAESVSLINLIATPEKYQGKLVQVEGVCLIEFEGWALFLSKDDRKHGFTKNALWASYYTLPGGDSLQFQAKFDGRHVLVEGYFDAQSHGHMGLFSGSITNVTRIRTW